VERLDDEHWYSILAQILNKCMVTNFGISLYRRLVDPLSSYGGRFKWLPANLFQVVPKDNGNGKQTSYNYTELRDLKSECLKISALKWAIIWGIFTNMLLLNFALGALTQDESDLSLSDGVVGILFTIVAGACFPVGYLLIKFIPRKLLGDVADAKEWSVISLLLRWDPRKMLGLSTQLTLSQQRGFLPNV
jgi:hypothetical protein